MGICWDYAIKHFLGTDAGSDIVHISGNISGMNFIDTGAGNDLVYLNGTVDGDFRLDMGDGYNTLVLTADSWTEFQASYQSWLDANLSSMHVEAIHINLDGAALTSYDQNAIQSYFNQTQFTGISTTYTMDGTMLMDG